MSETLELRDACWNVVVAPSLGGSVLVCEHDREPVLHPTARPQRNGRPVHCCHFPLIPYSNRIENGLFGFRGRRIRLADDAAGSPHAIHGHGWQAVWQVVEHRGNACTLAFEHTPGVDWPWPYRGRQTLAIAGNELRFTLAIENLSSNTMPCGLGFHPFLPAPRGTRLRIEAQRVWDGTAGAFPSRRIAVPEELDFRNGPRIAERQGTDHCFDGWRGPAIVSYEHRAGRLVLTGCEATHSVIVYVPESGGYFCVEPVTHSVNALNLPNATESGLWTLAPHESRRIEMSIRCEPTTRGSSPRPSRTSGRSP
jgi:aldose 1-epimerase